MANPKFLYTDLSIPAYTPSGGSAAGFPISNLKTYVAADKWRSNSTTQGQTIIIDFGSAKACTFIALENHNFNTLGCSAIPLDAADDVGFTTNQVVVLSSIIPPSSALYVQEFSSVSRRFWRLTFNKGSALSAAPELGNLFLDALLDMSVSYNWGAEAGNKEYLTNKRTAISGLERASQVFGGKRRFKLFFSLLDSSFNASWNTFHDTVRGSLRPFYFVDVDGTTVRYLRFVNDYNPVKLRSPGRVDVAEVDMIEQLAS